MSVEWTRRTNCCLCDAGPLEVVLPLEPSPIGDAFLREDQRNHPQPLVPLDVALCHGCGHVQLMDIVAPQHLFVDYLFQTSTSGGLVEHLRQQAETLCTRFALAPGDKVLEIGSNDGTLLHFLKQRGLSVQGVDPSVGAAAAAEARGVPTAVTFFSHAVAATHTSDWGPARLIVANNVFAHSNHLGNMVEGIRRLLANDGVFVFEVSYLVDMIDRLLFDTIYHEHISYHTVQPLITFFGRHGLQLFDIERVGSKGGSLRCFVQRRGGPHALQASVSDHLAVEAQRGFGEPDIYHEFSARLNSLRDQFAALLDQQIPKGRIVGYGASPTTTTLISHFRLGDRLQYLIDDNPLKQGLYSPGWKRLVRPSSILLDDCPDGVVILAWQYAAPILERNRPFRDQGGRFFIPLPEPRLG